MSERYFELTVQRIIRCYLIIFPERLIMIVVFEKIDGYAFIEHDWRGIRVVFPTLHRNTVAVLGRSAVGGTIVLGYGSRSTPPP